MRSSLFALSQASTAAVESLPLPSVTLRKRRPRADDFQGARAVLVLAAADCPKLVREPLEVDGVRLEAGAIPEVELRGDGADRRRVPFQHQPHEGETREGYARSKDR